MTETLPSFRKWKNSLMMCAVDRILFSEYSRIVAKNSEKMGTDMDSYYNPTFRNILHFLGEIPDGEYSTGTLYKMYIKNGHKIHMRTLKRYMKAIGIPYVMSGAGIKGVTSIWKVDKSIFLDEIKGDGVNDKKTAKCKSKRK